MLKRFFTVDNQCLHVRIMGKGPPILLLHASPSSSKMMIPLMQQLSSHFTVIAPDTPGYGLSLPLNYTFNEVADYAEFYIKFANQLELKKWSVYGTATGAQIAIRMGLNYPGRIDHLFLDNAAHFDDELRKSILQSYFPDLSPQADGSHLAKLWTMVRDLFVFFPWSFRADQYRLQSPFPPVQVLQAVAIDFLQAGANYHLAYRAAFKHEKAEFVQELSVPTTIFNWEASIVKPYVVQLLQHDLPNNVVVIKTKADRLERLQKMSEHIKSKINSNEASLSFSKNNEGNQGYFHLKKGAIHYFRSRYKDGIPHILLHDFRSSAAVLLKKMEEYFPNTNVFAVNLPGHGDSDHFDLEPDPTIFAQFIYKILTKAGFSKFTVSGLGWSRQIANILNHQYGVGVKTFRGPDQLPLPPIQADEYGMHLFKGWFYLRDRALFENAEKKKGIKSPHNALDDAEFLQTQLTEWLKCKY